VKVETYHENYGEYRAEDRLSMNIQKARLPTRAIKCHSIQCNYRWHGHPGLQT